MEQLFWVNLNPALCEERKETDCHDPIFQLRSAHSAETTLDSTGDGWRIIQLQIIQLYPYLNFFHVWCRAFSDRIFP